ncbi:MAG: hypothetical protein NXI12_14260 [Alphaproteobacteria bacterium]|nr:hypothetical protein [Alphaproteobacteria bacterium]
MRSLFTAIAWSASAILALWITVTVSERLSRPQDMVFPLPVSLYLPDSNGVVLPDARPVQPEAISEPAYVYWDETRSPGGVFRHEFTWSPSDGEVALYLTWTRRITNISLNGQPVSFDIRSAGWSTLAGFQPGAFPLGEDLLNEGLNVIEITDRGRSKKVLPAFSIVPVEQAAQAAFWGRFFHVDLVIASIGAMIFVFVFCGLVRWPAGERTSIRLFMVLLAAWCLRDLAALGLTQSLPNGVHLLAGYWISYALVTSFAVYVAHRTSAHRYFIPAYLALLALAMGATAAVSPNGGQAIFELAFPIESIMTGAFAVVILAQLFWALLQDREGRKVELALLVVAIGAIAMDALDDRFELWVGVFDWYPYVYYATPRYGLLLALGMLSALAFQQARTSHLAMNLNRELDSRLREKEAELARSFEAREQLERREAASAERERIMMDVHDGLGARLAALDILSRDVAANEAAIRREVQASMGEVRLIADSLNTHGACLGVILAALRQRVTPQFSSGSVALDWAVSAEAAALKPDAEVAMHLSRILLEAMTNCLRHSGAHRLHFRVDVGPDKTRPIQMVVEDDGRGLSSANPGGRGMAFMKSRSAKIGADIRFEDSAPGLRIEIAAPLVPQPSTLAASRERV